jgi:membrane-associated phospholipid phosphatase
MRLPRSDSGAARAGALVHRHRPTLIALGAVALALALVGLVLAKAGVLPRSSWSDVLVARERYPGALLDAAGAVAFLARPVVAALTVLGASAVALLRFGPRWGAVVLGAVLVTVAAAVLKHAVGPATSLPSGHAAYAAAVFGAVACLSLADGRRGAALILLLASIAMAAARVLQGAHEPADAVAGLALGWAWLVPLLLLAARRSPSPTDHIVPWDAEHPSEHAALGRDRGAGAGRLDAELGALRHDGSA